jgi:RecB family exonuclease
LETNNREKATKGEDLPAERLQELWDDTWATRKIAVDNWFEEKPDDIQARGRALVAHYRRHKAGDITPWSLASIEKPIEGLFGGVPMTGVIDLINAPKASTDETTAQPQILDYKTGKQAKTMSDLECSIQLGVYAELTGIRNVSYVTLQKTKEPKIVTVQGTRTERSIERTKTVVQGVSAAIHAGSFPYANPNDWKCCPQYCGVWYACKQGSGDK